MGKFQWDVEEEFTDEDNKMLEAEITDEEVKLSLQKSNKTSSPGSDGITFLVYEHCWSSIGRHLCEVVRHVVKEGTPSTSMQHSLMVFSPKPGKTSSILPKHKRKLSQLQTDWKIITGILAQRLRKTEEHTMSKQQYAAGPRRITQAICEARDTILNISPNNRGCAILELDFMAGYDMLSLSWTWKTLRKKKCSPTFCETMRKLYQESPSYIICTINNQQQSRILNKRGSIKQGDRASTALYCFSTSPFLSYLQKRLQGIMYHKLSTEGPAHPILGPPLPVEARLRAIGFVDDLKCGVSSIKEFGIVEAAVKLFEEASASRLHRDPSSMKCSMLTLGKWSNWTQSQSPIEYIAVVQELNFLGVLLGKTTAKSRAANGDFLTKKIKTTMAAFKAGRHMPLVCRPFAINTYILSKLAYKGAVFNMRRQDITAIMSTVKQWLSQDLLIKPPEALVYRDPQDGGLGLVHAGARCNANLLSCFVQQGHPESKYPSIFLNSVYRCYVLKELEEHKVRRPPYYSQEFFDIINEARAEWGEDVHKITTRGWQERLMRRGITHLPQGTNAPEIIKTNQEERLDQADWSNVWNLRRRRGLTQSQKSWIFKWTEGLHLCNERLCRIGKLPEPKCDFCSKTDDRTHILRCAFNGKIAAAVNKVLETATGGMVSEEDLGILDLKIPDSLQVPVLFLFVETISRMQKSRKTNKPLHIQQLRADIQAASKSFLLTEKFSFANAMIELWMASFFSEDEEGAPSGTAATVPSSSRVPAVMGAHHPQSQSHQQPGGGQTSGHPMV